MSETRIEMCALCGKPTEVVTIKLGGGPAVPITSCECVNSFPGRPQMVMVKNNWIDEINKHEHNVRRPAVRFADLDKGDQLQILKDCNDRAMAEVSAHFDKTYGEQIEALARENERLRAELGDRSARSARFRELQDEARRKERERVVLDTSMWDD